MASKIQLRRDTAANWASVNPILASGEIGFVTDTNKFKIGDGTTAFNSLSFFNGNLTGSVLNDLSDVTITSATNGDFLKWNGTAWVNDSTVVTLTGSQTLSNKTLTTPVLSTVGGDEGGEIQFGPAGTRTTLSGNIVVDIYQNKIRFYEAGGSSRGAYLDLSTCVNGVATDILGDVTANSQTASYTLVLTDKRKMIEMNVGSANNLTVPPNSSVAFPVGTQITVLQVGSGQTTIVAGSGVTVNGTPGLKLRAQWSSATLVKRATDTWVALGDLQA